MIQFYISNLQECNLSVCFVYRYIITHICVIVVFILPPAAAYRPGRLTWINKGLIQNLGYAIIS